MAPKGLTTRPTTDRVRESVFSALTSLLGPQLGGGRVLDAFAGSGALGLEALSRGAEHATFVEKDRRALAALRSNIEGLGVSDAAMVSVGDVFSLANRGIGGGPFSLLLLDPPYTLDPSEISALLESLATTGVLEPGCVVTLEHAAGTRTTLPLGFRLLQMKRYGSTEVDFAVCEGGSGTE